MRVFPFSRSRGGRESGRGHPHCGCGQKALASETRERHVSVELFLNMTVLSDPMQTSG